jgi:hypothetical protein
MKKIVLVLFLLSLVGCAATPQHPINISENYWQEKQRTVGIVMTAIPERDFYIYGADCLLCIMAAQTANSSVSTHTATLSDEELPKIKQKMAEVLKEQGVDAVVLDDAVIFDVLPKNKSDLENASEFDFSTYKTSHNLTHLLIVEVNRLGMTRGYSAYFPVTDPRTIFSAKSYLVDLEDNTFDFYYLIELEKSAHENWDEPPLFPALTNSYYQVLAEGKDKIIDTIKASN